MAQPRPVRRGLPLMETLATDHIVRKWWEGRLPASKEIIWPNKPTEENLLELRASMARSSERRDLLVESVTAQYKRAGMLVPERVAALGRDDTRTVTTGHQLCLATGPAFTYYKVLSAVVLAKQIETRWGTPVVPVFWLASEDHDFEEIQSLWDGHGWQDWSPSQTGGAVGRMSTDGLESMLSAWSDKVGLEEERKNTVLGACSGTLASAMRGWIHGAFGQEQIVVVDGDDAALKSAFAESMLSELSEQIVSQEVSKVNAVLDTAGHSPQVHVRPVNLFYLTAGSRSRIEHKDSKWLAGDRVWSSIEAVLEELNGQPERFSPNALLRPVYQSFTLPDVAVVGGLAEVAYWLQLSSVFPAMGVVQPALVPRDRVRVLPRKLSALAREFGMSEAQFDERLEVWEARHVAESDPPDTRDWRDAVSRASAETSAVFQDLDPSLLSSVASAEAKMTKLLDKLDEQARRAIRRKSQVSLDRLARLHAGLFPDGKAQERVVNWHVLATQWAAGSPESDSLEAVLDAHFQQGHDQANWSPLLHTLVTDSD